MNELIWTAGPILTQTRTVNFIKSGAIDAPLISLKICFLAAPPKLK